MFRGRSILTSTVATTSPIDTSAVLGSVSGYKV